VAKLLLNDDNIKFFSFVKSGRVKDESQLVLRLVKLVENKLFDNKPLKPPVTLHKAVGILILFYNFIKY